MTYKIFNIYSARDSTKQLRQIHAHNPGEVFWQLPVIPGRNPGDYGVYPSWEPLSTCIISTWIYPKTHGHNENKS